MNKTQIRKQLTDYYRVMTSMDWTLKLLREQEDTQSYKEIKIVRDRYNDKFLNLLRSSKIEKITIYPNRKKFPSGVTFTYKIDETLINKNLQGETKK